jgi:hypothetical protein
VLLDDLESTAREKQALMERLRQQLLKLAEHTRKPAHPPADRPAPSTADPHAVPSPPEDHGPEAPPGPDAGHSPPEPAPHGQPARGEAANAGEALDSTTHDEPPAPVSADLPGTRINRLALADSLFGSGQIELALQAYNSIELTRLAAADRYWIEYQIANCHRRLGDSPESERRYRRLAGAVDGGWCAAHARWWLDAISTRTALQRDLQTIQKTLQTINEQLEQRSNEQATR